jgi:glycerophosphoryl diester phosphodiesterase
MPENTIASEKNAIDYGCTLEMDLQMSEDGKIVVSHDSYFNAAFCLTPEGDTMSAADGRSRLIYQMPYDSVKLYDVGMKPYRAFPRQKKIRAAKPLLSELIDSVEAYAATKGFVNHYNIEIKSNPKADGRNYSSLEAYIDSAMKIIQRSGIEDRTMMQSFDLRALRILHKRYKNVKTSYLVGAADPKTAKEYIKALGFRPDIFSPEYSIVTADLVHSFHRRRVKVIPWTPNTLVEIQRLKELGVDGVITDYPDLFAQLR